MRRLLLLGSAVVFLDVAFYTAITPLLPRYVDDLGLSKGGAGVLSAAYAAGTLIASLPAGLAAARVGPRRALLSGLLLLGLASLAFGFARQAWLLDAARFVQGVAGAMAWAGALTWLVIATPEKRRGSVIGDVLGAAIAGALLGPGLGALAEGIGTEPIFSSVLALSMGLSLAALRIPEPASGDRQSMREVREAIVSPGVLRATSYVAAPSALFGVVAVLFPLRINELGGGAGLVAAGFTVGAGLEAVLAPLVGRLSDRAGRVRPYRTGMLIGAAAIALVPLAEALGLVLALLIAVSLGAGVCFVPALAMLSDSADASGLHQGLATGLINVAWASGQVLGSVGGGAAASVATDALPCLLVAALLVATAAAARQGGVRSPRTGPPRGALIGRGPTILPVRATRGNQALGHGEGPAVSLRAGRYTFSHVTYDPPSDVLYAAVGQPRPGRREQTPESHYLRFDARGRLVGIIFMNPREQLEREGGVYVSLPEGDRVRVQGIESLIREPGE